LLAVPLGTTSGALPGLDGVYVAPSRPKARNRRSQFESRAGNNGTPASKRAKSRYRSKTGEAAVLKHHDLASFQPNRPVTLALLTHAPPLPEASRPLSGKFTEVAVHELRGDPPRAGVLDLVQALRRSAC
jgi:hypothetical protein